MGDLFANVENREISGLLLPYGEASRTNMTKTPPVMFSKDTILDVPRDITMVGLNMNHDRFTWAGRVKQLVETAAGRVAVFSVADTDEGDEALAAVASGRLKKLSAEVVNLVVDGTRAVSAKLTGAALVSEGAFASAALFALDLAEAEAEVPTEPAPADPAPPAAPEEEEEEEIVPEAQIPSGLPAPAPAAVLEKPRTRGEMFAKIDAAMGGRASVETLREVREYLSGSMFALSDIDYDGGAGVGAKMTAPAWIGEVLDGTTYRPKFAGLFGQKNLTALAMSGWKWGVKPAGATWTGNKDAISSNTPTILPVSENATRWAGGHDIAREHRDFGTPGFFEAYNAAMLESFLRWLDVTIVLTEALAAATDLEADNPGTNDPGWWAVIDGAASIVAAGLTPTGAVVASGLWKGMARVNNSDVLGYLNASLSLTGDARLDTFQIIPAAPTELTAGHALVVAREAADVYTLPGSPIRAEAQNIANGGIDVGHFGYGGFLVKNAAGIVDVGPYTP